ncbi:glycosyltransferase [Pseudarthrobacter sp. AL07]|uniref:glycosyltransferase n=1 Tax=unclassified Pseudarthrobacter TaxID=2647000 RepID=UPI00249AF216|nr:MULTISPECIES: glycosyltransferase [unclassified Pseudarthrobacter]MDI3193070.1 glycosyltransferase [Pseudarthrobacter sp. AL20]MDI3207110.1 glycosyltransferase [Pseudarthrobacter sp. AL07]
MITDFTGVPEPISSRETRASVCLASYRGGRYITEQLESILTQLGPDDELVIVDDASPDNTVEQIRTFEDGRIRLIEAAVNQGYVRSFEQAALAARGKYILLADQDDVWVPGRLELMIGALQGSMVVATNFDVLGGGPRPNIPRLRDKDSRRHAANILGILVGYRAYYGCGMGFRRDMLPVFSPVPRYLNESHDLWLAICGNLAGSIQHLDESTLLRRIHDDNATPRGWRSLSVIFRARVILLRCIARAWRRLRQPS